VANTISIDFSRPIALFPLGGTILLPHAPQALHLFEPRYRQMIEACLDEMEPGNLLSAAPIAMATYGGREWEGRRVGDPPLRPAVCVGKIVQHSTLPDGRHNIILHGVCRARIDAIHEPEGERLYRTARLSPLEGQRPMPRLLAVRRHLRSLLDGPRLRRMCGVDAVREWVGREDVPTHALVELVTFALLKDDEVRYRMLEEADPRRRARLLTDELRHLDRLVALADRQDHRAWPKGMSWN
jgi:Lon protease-like protein